MQTRIVVRATVVGHRRRSRSLQKGMDTLQAVIMATNEDEIMNGWLYVSFVVAKGNIRQGVVPIELKKTRRR